MGGGRRGFAARVALALTLVGSGWIAALGRPASVSAATPWSIALSPATLTEGVATTVTVTVTSGNQDIGCLALDIPSGFTVLSTGVSSVPAGFVWSSSGAGAGPTQVTLSTTKDAWRLKNGAKGVFAVRVVATTSPLSAWGAGGYQKFTVDPKQVAIGPLVPPAPFVIVPAPTPTPTPTPTPAPTPAPTPTPTPAPTPTPTPTPTPAPTSTPTPTPTPANTASGAPNPSPTLVPPWVTPASGESPSPAPSPSPVATDPAVASEMPSVEQSVGPTQVALGGPIGSGGDPGSGDDGTRLDVRALPAGGSVRLDDLQALGTTAMVAWLVPGLLLFLPSLLIVVIVLAQTGFAAVFIPVTRRVLGGGARRRSRRERDERLG